MDYDRLVARHKDAVYRQMVRVCGNRDDAEDVLVEALLNAYRASDQLEDPSNFRAWVTAIGRRACGKLKKREALRPVLSLSALEEVGIREQSSGEPSQQDQFEMARLKDCVFSAVDSLPPNYQNVYRLREVEGLSAQDTASRLGLTVATVKSRLHRARIHVRSKLDESLCAPK